MGRRTRPERRSLRVRQLRFARYARLRRPRRPRRMERATRLRPRLVSERRWPGLGALQRRLLELGCPVGLDLDRLRALGLCSLPLRPLGLHWRPMGLVPWPVLWLPGLRPCVCRLARRRLWIWLRRRLRCGLVPAGLGRTLLS